MIYIVRHGQTAKNKQKVLQGRSDLPMNDEGRQQACKAGAKLAELGVRPLHVYSSPLIRAVETAELIASVISSSASADAKAESPACTNKESVPDTDAICSSNESSDSDLIAPCPVRTDDRLIEMDYGPYEGMDLTKPAPEVMAFFMDFAGTPAPDGMEQLSSVVERAGRFLEEIREEAMQGDVIISTHAIAMKGLLEYLTPESKGSYWSTYIGNCEIYAAEVTEGGYGIPYSIADQNIEVTVGV